MNEFGLEMVQLQKHDPKAWTALLQRVGVQEDVVVTAVTTQVLPAVRYDGPHPNIIRYLLTLANHTDPITCIGKHTIPLEAHFYQEIAPKLNGLAPECWFSRIEGEHAWLILEDIPNNYPPETWTPADVENIINDTAELHATFWDAQQEFTQYPWLHGLIDRQDSPHSWPHLKETQAPYFDKKSSSGLSEHAIQNAGRLAPMLLQAANGLAVIRDLGGWPGILTESHLAAVAELLDDPVPMLQPLENLPHTLLHGDLYNYQWHLGLFGERRLLDWQTIRTGPCVHDLINFTEQFDLLYMDNGNFNMQIRRQPLVSDETIIDSYMLAMSSRLGPLFNARAVRQALPAARCLHVLLHWFPHFANWFSHLPSKLIWQKVNRMSDEQLIGTIFQPMIGFRPYLTAVFRRFLQAYKTL